MAKEKLTSRFGNPVFASPPPVESKKSSRPPIQRDARAHMGAFGSKGIGGDAS